jgi:hypothetical protein
LGESLEKRGLTAVTQKPSRFRDIPFAYIEVSSRHLRGFVGSVKSPVRCLSKAAVELKYSPQPQHWLRSPRRFIRSPRQD